MQILRSNFSITENCIRFRSWVTYEVNILFAAWFLAFIIPRNRHNFTRRVPSTHSVLRLWIFLPIEHDVLHLIDVRFFRRRRRRCRCCCCCCCSQFIQSFRSRIKHCCSCVAKNAKESVGDGEVRRWWRWRRNSDDSEFIDVTEFGLASQNRFHDLFLFVNSHLHSNWIYIYTFIEYAKRQNAVIFCLFVVRFFTSIFTAVLFVCAHTIAPVVMFGLTALASNRSVIHMTAYIQKWCAHELGLSSAKCPCCQQHQQQQQRNEDGIKKEHAECWWWLDHDI